MRYVQLGDRLLEMITRRLPFGGVRREELAIIGYKYATGERPEIPHANPKIAPASFIKTIEDCILNTIGSIQKPAQYYKFCRRKTNCIRKDTRFGFHA